MNTAPQPIRTCTRTFDVDLCTRDLRYFALAAIIDFYSLFGAVKECSRLIGTIVDDKQRTLPFDEFDIKQNPETAIFICRHRRMSCFYNSEFVYIWAYRVQQGANSERRCRTLDYDIILVPGVADNRYFRNRQDCMDSFFVLSVGNLDTCDTKTRRKSATVLHQLLTSANKCRA